MTITIYGSILYTWYDSFWRRQASELFRSVAATADGLLDLREWRHVAFPPRGGLPPVTRHVVGESEQTGSSKVAGGSNTVPAASSKTPNVREDQQRRHKVRNGPEPTWWGGKGYYDGGKLVPSKYLKSGNFSETVVSAPILHGCTYDHSILHRTLKGADQHFYAFDGGMHYTTLPPFRDPKRLVKESFR